MKSADVPEYSSPSGSDGGTVSKNVRLGVQTSLPGTNQGGDQTHRSEVKPRAFWGRRGFSRGRSRNAGPAGRRYPAVGRIRGQTGASESHTGPG